jgi:Tetratricopeptide repeat.
MKKSIFFIIMQLCILTSVAQINTDRVITLGRNSYYFEDYILAIKYFNEAIRAKPWLDKPYFYRAISKLNLDDYVGAEEDCSLALEQNPFMTQAYFARGIARQSLGKYDLAIEDYKKALEFRPNDRPMMTNKAIAHIQKKDYTTAKVLFNELIEAFPREANNYLARGSMNIETGDTIAGLTDFNKAIELDPYYAPAYGNRAILNFQTNNMEDALKDLNEALRLEPREVGYYVNRGLIRYNLNDLRGAMSDYDQAISLSSNNIVARFNRGLLRHQVGDFNRAIEDFDVVISLEPDNYMAYYNRALLYSSVGNHHAAIKDLDILLNQYPNFSSGYYTRAESKRSINDIDGAEKDMWNAMELSRNSGAAQTAQVGSGLQDSNSQDNSQDKDEEKMDTRDESDKNINKFKSLVMYNKEEEQKSKYKSEIRGRVQDKNVTISPQPQFVLTFYEKISEVKENTNYNKTIVEFNEKKALGWVLIITNNETSLNEFQINTHFESINVYSEKIEQNENNADYYFGRGIDLMLVQDFSEAINNFDNAINIDPSFTLAYFNRAAVRYKQLEYELSNTAQDELVEMNVRLGSNNLLSSPVSSPSMTRERDNRSRTYDLIIKDYNKIIELEPGFTFAYFNRANLRFLQRDFRTAITDYAEAIRRNPDFAEAYFNRGLARLSQGDTQSGIADLSKAGELGIIEAYSIIRRMTK